MNKKVSFVVSLLALASLLVVAFAPAGMANAAAPELTLTAPPWITDPTHVHILLNYSVSNYVPDPALTQLVLFARVKQDPPAGYTGLGVSVPLPSGPGAPTSFSGTLEVSTYPAGFAPVHGDEVEWFAKFAGAIMTLPTATVPPLASSKVDLVGPEGFGTVAPRQWLQPSHLPICQPAAFYVLSHDPATDGVASGFSQIGFSLAGYPLPDVEGAPLMHSSEYLFSMAGLAGTLNFTDLDQAGNGNAPAALFTWNEADYHAMAACPTFTADVPADYLFAPYIGYLAQMGVIRGYSATAFGPEDTITRGQFALLIARALNGGTTPTTSPSGECVFTDVPPATGELFDAVSWACNNGVIKGYGGGLFGPHDPLTRGHTVLMLRRANKAIVAGSLSFDDSHAMLSWEMPGLHFGVRSATFADVNALPMSEAELADAINTFYNAGILDGYNATTFGIFDPLKRGQLAKILYRSLSDVF